MTAGDPSPGAPGEEPPAERRPPRKPARRPARRSIPAWVVLPAATIGGWFAAGWPGAVFGALAGFLLWRSRR